MKKPLYNILFLLLFAGLLLPYIEHKLHIFKPIALKGDVTYAPNIGFTLKGWWDGTFQSAKANYINDNMGLRQNLVRINNEIDYRLFHKVHAKDVVVGKDYYLFEKGYIDKYCAVEYMGDSTMRAQLIKLKMLQDTFAKNGKLLILLHAPSKARYFPHQIPANLFCNPQPAHSLYNDFKKIEDSLKVENIDFMQYLLSMRDTTKHVLISKSGVHWTVYGSLLAWDSLRNYLSIRLQRPLPLRIVDKVITSSPRSTDIDIADGLNIMSQPPKEDFTYHDFHFNTDTGKGKPNMIFIGDSFTWTLFYNYLPHNFCHNYEFWYYFREIWFRKNGVEGEGKINNYNWLDAMPNYDVVAILCTEPALGNIGWNFVDLAFDHYYPNMHIK